VIETSKVSGPFRPLGLTLLDRGARLLVADREKGTILLLDAEQRKELCQINVGRQISDVAANDAGDLVLATAAEMGQIVLFSRKNLEILEKFRLPVGPSPVSVQLNADGDQATVALLWPRRLAFLDLAAQGKKPSPPHHLDLPFAPRHQLWVRAENKVIVADAFGGKIAVVDPTTRQIESVRELRAHNIRGLALSHDRKHLLLTHQILFATGRPNRGEIQAGNMLTNKLTVLPLADLFSPGADIWRGSQSYELGDIERGAGDPAGVVQTADGKMLVALAGTNELAIGQPEKVIWQRLPVGDRPTALVVDEARRRAYIANTLGGSITVVDLAQAKVAGEIRLGRPAPLSAVQRGEKLFYDARLSQEAWFSCHSCHSDGHTNGLLNDNFTDSSFGTPKRVLSLLGVKDTGPYAWGGHVESLAAQTRSSITGTMNGIKPTDDQVRDLVSYLQTLTPPPSVSLARGTIDAETVQRGRKVFLKNKCHTCHTPPHYTTAKSFDVGLRDEAGQVHFNPPSLRGVSQSGPYFHDNRARGLAEVFTRFRHQLAEELPAGELADLLSFLGSL
jgi:DNA-binding beta-propeller fold protein YncE